MTSDPRIDLLDSDYVFEDDLSVKWTARKGLRWDGASIPRVLWASVGSPKTGCYRFASIIHDEYYKNCGDYSRVGVTRKDTDRMFYSACRAKGVGRARAGAMYYALRWFGTRWADTEFEPTESLPQEEQELLFYALETYLERRHTLDAEGADRLDEEATLEEIVATTPAVWMKTLKVRETHNNALVR